MATSTVGRLMPEEDTPSSPGRPSIKELAIRSVSVDAVHEKIAAALQEETLLDEPLSEEISVFSLFSSASYPFSQAFMNRKAYISVLKAMQRQLNKGSPEHMASTLASRNSLGTQPLSVTMQIFMDLIGNTNMMDVYAAAMIIPAKYPIRSDWNQERTLAKHDMYKYWKEIAGYLQFDEAKAKEGWKQNKQCCNPPCPNRSSASVAAKNVRVVILFSIAMRLVKKVSDWKEHNRVCRET
ncbi:hypothetical protein M422DRAFT_41763 [Sphaerobolus stellatus SS14]|nr:hypothetical protein M422DRAFT_41763 [Sphaerobolus stellatus SS14]